MAMVVDSHLGCCGTSDCRYCPLNKKRLGESLETVKKKEKNLSVTGNLRMRRQLSGW
jgi:hypothetical protein